MTAEKNKQAPTRLHPRNRNRERYDLEALIMAKPELANYIKPNKSGMDSIDFSNPVAVKLLNQGLLHHYYGIQHWAFPDDNLCPAIPGRADYLHHMADLLSESNVANIPKGKQITCLDVGVGANCIYPIIGIAEYGWNFIGSDVDSTSIKAAQAIVHSNASLAGKVNFRLQKDGKNILVGLIKPSDKIDLTVCNPPFHTSKAAAQKGTQRKIKNLSNKKEKIPTLNFAGINNELVYQGGERQFIKNMIRESEQFAKQCYWFSTLVSKHSNLKGIYKLLENMEVPKVKTIAMGTGNKSSRIVAWTFLSKQAQNEWKANRWTI